jgi:hypothetical protein
MGVCGHCSFRFGLQGVEPILANGFFMAMRSIAIGIGIGGEGGVLIATTPAVIY